jgi:dipeptidyl aminopeptidase/acylaminoacyl peptidase
MFYPNHKPINFKLRRFANHIATGGVELNQMRIFVERTPDPTPEAWYTNWKTIAEEELQQGQAALAAGHNITARDFLLRASGYFRESYFYLRHDHPGKLEEYVRSRDAFHAAMPFMDHKMEQVEIPWGGKHLPGYLAIPNKPGPVPCVVFIGGADAAKEEIYFTGGKRLVDRGFAVLMLDGPGQGEARLMRNIYACADWDTIGQALFDTVASRPEIDKDRIGLLGISMGGFYAPKAASGGAPWKCLAVWGACFDVWEDLYQFYPHIRPNMEGIANVSPAEAEAFYANFNLKDAAPGLKMPVLITHGSADSVVSKEAAVKFRDALTAPCDYYMFEGAIHCCYDIPTKVIPLIFDWLGDHLA